MNILKKFAFVLSILAISNAANAQQKIAHVNKNDIMQKMDEYKIAELVVDSMTKAVRAEIDAYQVELQKKQEAYTALPPNTSEAIKRLKEKELTDLDQRIRDYAQNAQTEIQNKSAELLEPIQKKLISNIEQVAKEKGYSYVLDDEALLVKPEADDISAAVKAKLGIKTTPAPAPAPAPGPAPAPKK